MDSLTGPKIVNPTTLAAKRYRLRFSIAMVVYAAVLFASITLVQRIAPNPIHTLIALLPIIPLVFVFVFVVQFINSIDELERQILVESLAVAAGATALAAVTYGFLEVAGFPNISIWYTYLFVMGAWLIAQPLVRRRYK